MDHMEANGKDNDDDKDNDKNLTILFDNFLHTAKTKLSGSDTIRKPLDYVEKLFKSLTISNLINRKDTQKLTALIEPCKKHVENQTINSDDEDIFPFLLDLTHYLVDLIKTLTQETIRSPFKKPEQVADKEASKSVSSIQLLNVAEDTTSKKEESTKIESPTKRKISLIPITSEKSCWEGHHSKNAQVVEIKRVVREEKETVNKKVAEESIEVNIDEKEEELSDHDNLVLSRIEKLDVFCQKLHEKILEIESEELSLDELNSNENNFKKEALLKQRFNEAYRKLRRLCKENPHLVEGEFPKNIDQFHRTIKIKKSEFKQINEKVSHELNLTRKSLKRFPDFYDVKEWIISANQSACLNLNSIRIQEIAEDIFKEIGRILKLRRKKDLESVFEARTENKDHKEYLKFNENVSFIAKLEENQKMAKEKEIEILNQFVEKQVKQQENELEDGEINDETEDESEKLFNQTTDSRSIDETTNTSAESNETESKETESNGTEDVLKIMCLEYKQTESNTKTSKRIIESLDRKKIGNEKESPDTPLTNKKPKLEITETKESPIKAIKIISCQSLNTTPAKSKDKPENKPEDKPIDLKATEENEPQNPSKVIAKSKEPKLLTVENDADDLNYITID